MARQYIVAGAGGPVYVGETGSRSEIVAPGVFLNETSGFGGFFDDLSVGPAKRSILAGALSMLAAIVTPSPVPAQASSSVFVDHASPKQVRRSLVRDDIAAPVAPTAAVTTPSQYGFEYGAGVNLRKVVAPDPSATPVFVPTSTVTFASAVGEALRIRLRSVYDLTVMVPRAVAVVVPTPSQYGFDYGTSALPRKPRPADLPAVGPIAPPVISVAPISSNDQALSARQRMPRYEPYAWSPTVPPAAYTFASFGETQTINSWLVYDPTAQAPAFRAPVITPGAFSFGNTDKPDRVRPRAREYLLASFVSAIFDDNWGADVFDQTLPRRQTVVSQPLALTPTPAAVSYTFASFVGETQTITSLLVYDPTAQALGVPSPSPTTDKPGHGDYPRWPSGDYPRWPPSKKSVKPVWDRGSAAAPADEAADADQPESTPAVEAKGAAPEVKQEAVDSLARLIVPVLPQPAAAKDEVKPAAAPVEPAIPPAWVAVALVDGDDEIAGSGTVYTAASSELGDLDVSMGVMSSDIAGMALCSDLDVTGGKVGVVVVAKAFIVEEPDVVEAVASWNDDDLALTLLLGE